MSAPTWRNRIISYDTKPASQFAPNPLNWRTHPSVQREALRGLLGDVGWVGAVLENKQTGNLIDGHARIEEALNEDSTQLIPYLLVDLTPEEEKLVLASFDPISALATADSKRLEELLKDVSSSSAAVDSMLSELAKEHGVFTTDEPKDAEPQIDKAAELQQKWGTETGQLWVIGNHRLLVGDSTNKADVGRLCGNERVGAIVTDPPYGMDLDTDWSDVTGSRKSIGYKNQTAGKKHERVIGDDGPFDPAHILEFGRTVKEIFLFGADYYSERLTGKDSGSWLVWDKRKPSQSEAIGSEFELIWSKAKHKRRILRHEWFGFLSPDNQTEARNRQHPTQKPTSLISEILSFWKLLSPIVDFYAGSGTTLVAAENSSKACYAMEIDAGYVAVCLERMTTAFPHLKIEKVDQARAA